MEPIAYVVAGLTLVVGLAANAGGVIGLPAQEVEPIRVAVAGEVGSRIAIHGNRQIIDSRQR